MDETKTTPEANTPSSLNVEDVGGLRENEYLKDGIIYCKKCNKPKVAYLNFLDKWFRHMCECEKRAFDAEERKQKLIEKQEKYRTLLRNSLLGERYYNAKFEKTDLNRHQSFVTAFERCKKYCENSEQVLKHGYGIYFWGDSGSGKTHLMACMINSLTQKLLPCYFTNFSEIAKGLLRNPYFEEAIAEIDFLFIDDLGTERVQKNGESMWMQEKIYDIINKRYNNKKPTIFSSNDSLQQLVEEKGLMPKTVDRIMEMSSAILKVEGDSYRFNMRTDKLPF